MDFLQEDVDSMQRELETWRNENRELQSKLRYIIKQYYFLEEKFNLKFISFHFSGLKKILPNSQLNH